MLIAALSIGVAVSTTLFMLTGLSAGGIVTPGYLALVLDRPRDLALIISAAVLAWGLVRLVGDWLMLYGARRFGVTVLLGLSLSVGGRLAVQHPLLSGADWTSFGYVIPGLIAHQFDRQGFPDTMLMLAIAVPLVRVLLLGLAWSASW
jgi:poly-gamma-glutamate biosynthesis protein PgsC/CapC